MRLRIIHISCFLFCCFSIKAQELVFSNISTTIGLPSQECYKVHQDKSGYIWISTDNGLCLYGNGSLKIFDKQNGLSEESVYALSEDPKGTMWFATSDNRILYFNGKRLIEASFSKSYQKLALKTSAFPTPYILDMSSPKNYFISNYYYSCYIRNNQIIQVPGINNHIFTRFIKHKGQRIIPNSYRIENNPSSSIIINNGSNYKKIDLKQICTYKNTPTLLCGNTDFIGVQNTLVRLQANLSHSLFDFPDRILQLQTNASGGLWVCVQNYGVYYFSDIHSMQLTHHSLNGFSVTDVCEDNEGGVWCTTLEKGVFYSRNKELISYTGFTGLNKKVSLLKYLNGHLFASSSSNLVYDRINEKRFTSHYFSHQPVIFTDIMKQGESWILTGPELTIRTTQEFNFRENIHQQGFSALGNQQLAHDNKGHLFGILNKSLTALNSGQVARPHYYNHVFSTRTMIHKKGNVFLFGGDQGLYELNMLTLKPRKIKGVPDKIKKIIKTRSGRIWIATKNDGIYWLDGEKITNASQELKLSTLLFYDLTEDPQGAIWAGSNQGLYHFSKENGHWYSRHYTPSHGLPSNEVNKVAADSSHIWFSLYEGLFCLPLGKNLINSTAPVIHLQKLNIDGKVRNKNAYSIHTSYYSDDFHFTFDILTFKNGKETKLEYILKTDDQTFRIQLDGNEILLKNLDPGKYQLIVYGINNDGVKSTKPEIFVIDIDSPFWMTWWFIILVLLAAFIFILLIVRLIIRGIRKKEEAKTQINKLIAEYQITALQAQMNPHFIFNAINTIQGYILEKNEEEAYNYLAKFSKLIRTVLHHSQEKVLLLEHEIEVLNLYIELEKLRFDNCFDYELKLSEEVDTHDIHLPGMILQPYVENAIWHGIVNLRGMRRGKLTISMERTNDLLIISIEDNGIGREKAMSFNKDKRHKSVGMQLTGERLKAMNQLHGYETARVTVSDLFNESGEAAGTKVTVNIPINSEL